MTTFGDVRSACQAKNRSALEVALQEYDDVEPAEIVRQYVVRAFGELPVQYWLDHDGVRHARAHGALRAWQIDALTLKDKVMPIRVTANANIGSEVYTVGLWDEPAWLAIQMRTAYLDSHRELMERCWTATPDVIELTVIMTQMLESASAPAARLERLADQMRGRYCPQDQIHVALTFIRFGQGIPFSSPGVKILDRLEQLLLSAREGEGDKKLNILL